MSQFFSRISLGNFSNSNTRTRVNIRKICLKAVEEEMTSVNSCYNEEETMLTATQLLLEVLVSLNLPLLTEFPALIL